MRWDLFNSIRLDLFDSIRWDLFVFIISVRSHNLIIEPCIFYHISLSPDTEEERECFAKVLISGFDGWRNQRPRGWQSPQHGRNDARPVVIGDVTALKGRPNPAFAYWSVPISRTSEPENILAA